MLAPRLPGGFDPTVLVRAQTIIGIAGGSGSGKTTLAHALVRALGLERCALIEHDAYYRDLTHLSAAERALVNFDHPDALDSVLLAQHLDSLRTGRAASVPIYDFATHTRQPDIERVSPRPFVVVDGILLFAVAGLRERFDLRVFVDTPADIRLIRRLQRDTQERGRDLDGVCRQYLQSVRPMHQQWVEASRPHADLTVSGTSGLDHTVQAVLTRFLEAHA